MSDVLVLFLLLLTANMSDISELISNLLLPHTQIQRGRRPSRGPDLRFQAPHPWQWPVCHSCLVLGDRDPAVRLTGWSVPRRPSLSIPSLHPAFSLSSERFSEESEIPSACSRRHVGAPGNQEHAGLENWRVDVTVKSYAAGFYGAGWSRPCPSLAAAES